VHPDDGVASAASCLPVRGRVALEQRDRVRQRRAQHLEAVPAASRRAGQVHDEGPAAHARESTRQQGMRRLRERVGADRLRDARRHALEHVAGRFGRHVAGGEAGAARGQDDRRLFGQLGDRLGDGVAVVGNDPALDLVALGREQPCEHIAALVLTRSLGNAVRDRQHGRPHSTGSFVFSTSRTSESSIEESIALAMS
jgi:hypothetical protein